MKKADNLREKVSQKLSANFGMISTTVLAKAVQPSLQALDYFKSSAFNPEMNHEADGTKT